MTIQQLRAAYPATPFRPFTLHVADGRSFPVPHPDFLSLSPTGRTIILYQEGEDFSILELLLMTEIQMNQPVATRPNLAPRRAPATGGALLAVIAQESRVCPLLGRPAMGQ